MLTLTTTWWSWYPGEFKKMACGFMRWWKVTILQCKEQTLPEHCVPEPCSIPESPRLRTMSEFTPTSPRWSSALTSHSMRFVHQVVLSIFVYFFLQCPVLNSPGVFPLTERLRLPADLQRQPSDRLSSILCELDGVQRWVCVFFFFNFT